MTIVIVLSVAVVQYEAGHRNGWIPWMPGLARQDIAAVSYKNMVVIVLEAPPVIGQSQYLSNQHSSLNMGYRLNFWAV